MGILNEDNNLAHGDCDYLHQYKVRWYETMGFNSSGKHDGTITEVSYRSVATWHTDDILGDGNPSYNQREGMRVYFWCESCSSKDEVFDGGITGSTCGPGIGIAHVLYIYQHKGSTRVEWGPDEPCDLTMVERAAIAEKAKRRLTK
jgi:hypothetical protein